MKLVCVVSFVLAAAGHALAQTPQGGTAPASRLVLASAETLLTETPPKEERDSLKNGAITGAVIGGAALGGFALWVCELLREEGNPPCWRGTLAIGAIGAGIGAAAGAGIDAMLSQGRRAPVDAPGRRLVLAWQRRF